MSQNKNVHPIRRRAAPATVAFLGTIGFGAIGSLTEAPTAPHVVELPSIEAPVVGQDLGIQTAAPSSPPETLPHPQSVHRIEGSQ
jgi:hypothetical protein